MSAILKVKQGAGNIVFLSTVGWSHLSGTSANAEADHSEITSFPFHDVMLHRKASISDL